MRPNATHVLLALVLLALVANAAIALRPMPARAAALESDLQDVVYEMRDLSSGLDQVSSRLDRLQSIDRSLEKIAGSSLWDVRPTSPGGGGTGLPVVVLGE